MREVLTKTFRNADRDRVIVRVTIDQTDRPLPGHDHTTVPAGATTVSFVGDVLRYRSRQPIACGQIISDVPDNRVAALWRRWHGNTWRTHCAHQNEHIPWDEVAPCEETGYRAGHSWLCEPVPAEVVESIREAMA